MKYLLTLISCFVLTTGIILSETLPRKGALIVDSRDKRNARGYIYLSLVYGDDLRTPSAYPDFLINLKEYVHKWTRINVVLDRPLELRSPRVHEMPMLYITSSDMFFLSPDETENICEYMENGGFLVLDNASPTNEESPQEASLLQLLDSVFGDELDMRDIPPDHPLLHIFYDFDDGPPIGVYEGPVSLRSHYIKGIWYKGRLTGLLSNRGYTAIWNDQENNDPQLRFGINMVVYALLNNEIMKEQNSNSGR